MAQRLNAMHTAVQEKMEAYAAGNLSASDKRRTEAFITQAFEPLCKKLAAKWHKISGLEYESLLGDARMGIGQAISQYDPVRYPGVKFAGAAAIFAENELRNVSARSRKMTTPVLKHLLKMDADVARELSAGGANADYDVRDSKLAAKLFAYTRESDGKRLTPTMEDAVRCVKEFRERQAFFNQQANPVKNTDEEGQEIYDLIADDNAQEGQAALLQAEETAMLRVLFTAALSGIDERNGYVFLQRQRKRPNENGGETFEVTLEDLAKELGLSRERIRQLEKASEKKFIAGVLNAAAAHGVTRIGGVDLSGAMQAMEPDQQASEPPERRAYRRTAQRPDHKTPLDPQSWICPE